MHSATDSVIRRLYEEPPESFVATRAAAVDEARREGDRDAAKRLAALKKPTVAAWVVNLLALKRPDLIGELVELSTALRAAQRDLQGEQLRELSQQRRQFVSALVAAARKLAVAAGAPAARLPLADVEATLTAALAEPEIAAQVRTGRLIRPANYAGFGEVPRPRLRLVTGEAEDDLAEEPEAEPEIPSITPRERAAADQRRRERERKRRELDRELSVALAAERRADEQLVRAESAERDAGHLVEDLDAELAELERRRTEAVADVARRKLARRTAERESAAARRRVGDVQAALDDLTAEAAD
ncbi:hypothetical protein AB0F81_15255 [Actinoplanes sp. NPDC024001]|uniref:hypothetical protein n=1 Tax=Actinoplanes sp. NPDC024001 TaxID=3154598 RepID=UPI0033E41061